MRSTRRSASSSLLGLFLALVSATVALGAGPQPSAFYMEGSWLNADGGLLPFRSDAEVIDFLETAQVVDAEVIPDTSAAPLRLILERDGVRARAIFRTVDVERVKMDNVREHARGFRDFYMFEVAAFQLSRLLGLDNVPPTTLRTVDGEKGSIQLWAERAQGIRDRLTEGIDERLQQLWLFQKQNMVVFDNLIYNFDRNPGNMLLDPRGKLWFVDHTRSFKRLPVLRDRNDIQVVERQLWENLQALDPEEVGARLEPYIDAPEIDAVMARRDKLVKLIAKRIAKHGEQAILFEFVSS